MALTLFAVLSLTTVAQFAALPAGTLVRAQASTDAPGSSTGLTEAAAVSRLDNIRGPMTSGHLADAVLAAAASVNVTVPVVPDVPAALPAGVPPRFAAPVAALLGALDTAAQMVHQAIHISPGDARTLITRNDALLREALNPLLNFDSPLVRQQLNDLQAQALAAVDRPTLYAGALLIAHTIDAWLPALHRAAAQDTAKPAGAVSGCDITDQPPVLCIGGTGDNTYTQDYSLLIDEGGHDTYLNAAAGSDPLTGQPAASLLIDLDGNDTFTAINPLTSTGFSIGVQGTGDYGIGMLVDTGGHDTYTATMDSAKDSSIITQGTGALGVGVLADYGGDNTFYAADTAPLDLVDVIGQGFATLGGMGILINNGGGSNSYTMYGRPAAFTDSTGTLHTGTAQTRGFGWAVLGGAAMWSDGGGTNTLEADGIGSPIPPGTTTVPAPSAPIVQGFGFASTAGGATLLSGSGDDTFTARADVAGPQAGAVNDYAFGFGTLGAMGAFYDSGGANTLAAVGHTQAVNDVTVGDGCSCTGVTASADSGGGQFIGDGAGAEGGTGLLQMQGGGADRYTVDLLASATASAEDDRTAGSSGDSGAVARAHVAATGSFAQGWGGDANGYLVDDGGNDSYSSSVALSTHATASAPNLTTEPIQAHALTDAAYTQAQAASVVGGEGALTDESGSDTYSVSTVATAVASPPTEQKAVVPQSIEQGGVSDSTTQFVDGSTVSSGDRDTYIDVPPDPACTGTRGQGEWVDCGLGLGTGIDLAGSGPSTSVPETPWAPLLIMLGAVAIVTSRRRFGPSGPGRSRLRSGTTTP